MKVSIIIPVYNVSKYLVRCLDSVVSQSFQDIECILVDDCGKDSSVDIAKEFIKCYQGPISFKLLHHERNRGLSAARNTGIEAANGDYLFFLDSDDTIVPDAIESLLNLFEKYPDINFAQGNILAEDGSISSYGLKETIPEYTCNHDEIFKIMLSEITTVAWNRLIKKDFVSEFNLYFPEGYFTEDMYWGYFIAKHAEAIAFTHKGLYVYYINEGSMMTLPSKQNRMKWLTSRLWTSNVYLADVMLQCQSKYQRQYIAINLLSCLVELHIIKSPRQWFLYWLKICKIALRCLNKITWYRFLFLIALLPPLCFYCANDKLRWRIQKNIISNV
jgi:glycosyltransferase involved in cell wall biosynthesis